jgi:hypothetical protein
MERRERTKKAVEPAAEDAVVYEGSSAYIVAMMGGRLCEVGENNYSVPDGDAFTRTTADEARREFRKGGAQTATTSSTLFETF